MFTGIIEEIGVMERIQQQGESLQLTIRAHAILEDIHLGDSIAINGVCLTVVSFTAHTFTVDVIPQTYRYTNLGTTPAGDQVNLERAMAAQGRFGGHIVQGHVDGVGTITAGTPDGNMIVYTIKPHDPHLMRYIIAQGSIAVDGISLTVSALQGQGQFTISLIPHTLEKTILQTKRQGDTVNLETDVLGKYVEHILRLDAGEERQTPHGDTLTRDYLAENGFA